MSAIASLIGLIFGQLPLIIAFVLCVVFPPFKFWKFYIFYSLLEAVKTGIIKQTAAYIVNYIPYPSMRSIADHRILSGTANLSDRISLGFWGMIGCLFNKKEAIASLFVSGVVTLLYAEISDYQMWKIIVTMLTVFLLLGRIIPIYFLLCATVSEPEITNETLYLGGKIKRKWYFFNGWIIFLFFVLLTFILYFLKSWVLAVIMLPYYLVLFVLHWGNVYKRINDISNSHKTSLLLTIGFAIVCYSSAVVCKFVPELETGIIGIMSFIWLFLLFKKSKKEVK